MSTLFVWTACDGGAAVSAATARPAHPGRRLTVCGYAGRTWQCDPFRRASPCYTGTGLESIRDSHGGCTAAQEVGEPCLSAVHRCARDAAGVSVGPSWAAGERDAV